MKRTLLSLGILFVVSAGANTNEYPLWFDSSDATYQSRADAKDLASRLEKSPLPVDPDTWTTSERIAALHERFTETETMLRALLLPEASAFLVRAQTLAVGKKLTLEQMKGLYRRERLDLTEAEDKAFRLLLAAWTQESRAAATWGPRLSNLQDLEDYFLNPSQEALQKLSKAARRRLFAPAHFLQALSRKVSPEFKELPLDVLAGGSFGSVLWGQDLQVRDWSRKWNDSAERSPAPSVNSGPLEKKLFALEEILAREFVISEKCQMYSSPRMIQDLHRSMLTRIATLRREFWHGRKDLDAALEKLRFVLLREPELTKSLAVWQAHPERLSALVQELTRDEFDLSSVSWKKLIEESLRRLPSQMHSDAAAMKNLILVNETLLALGGGRLGMGPLIDFEVDLLIKAASTRSLSGPEFRMVLSALQSASESLKFTQKRLERAKPIHDSLSISRSSAVLRQIRDEYKLPASPWPQPEDTTRIPVTGSAPEEIIRAMQDVVGKNHQKALVELKNCEASVPATSL